ncbi:hypothetical protein LTR56_024585 [Elasticomyces elasticus]|nr:hypothetical protein LTR56_024585 [Elasticomyces elasticus]KAK3622413.1 hypothetical protein LTR22_024798 [Elasticomyces elasticus]KAK4905476.1 hypothetical protein LTR49_025253 [Elasticomyces elasticus]KAK5746088.1 hypothetical protein LTS12_022855 [Elasticomyces elasticus]
MDYIQEWLQNTADREPPDQPEHQAQEHAPTEREQLGKKYRRKRKRASSDSSLLQPRHSRLDRAKSAHRASSSGGIRDATHGHPRRDREQSQSSVPSHREEAPRKSYEKRARHKTKADRYEPKSKNQHKDRDEPKTGSKRRKSHRSGDGGRTTGLVQSFQLKDGPQKSRLTLKPETNAGLFKHGRASAQVAGGRGAGLPDLVFNEMRFLEKPKDHQNRLPAEAERTTTKKHSKRQQEEQISAYFAHNKPAEAGPAVASLVAIPPPHEQQQPPSRTTHRKPATQPLVDLPDKPFLGFGSKGQHANSKEAGPTSYHSWSESVGPEARAGRSQKPANTDDRTTEVVENVGLDATSRQPAEPDKQTQNTASPRRGDWAGSRRAAGPAVEVFRPPAESKRRHERSTRSKNSVASLPHNLPSEPPHDAGQPRRKRGAPGSPEFHTSDILQVQQRPDTAADARHSHDTLDTVDLLRMRDQENRDPKSSTPTSKLLRRAQEAIVAQQTEQYPARKDVRRSSREHVNAYEALRPIERLEDHLDEREQQAYEEYINTNDMLHVAVGYNGVPRRRTTTAASHSTLPERRLQSASGLRPQSSRHTVRPDRARPSRTCPTPPMASRSVIPTMYMEDDEMLDQVRYSPPSNHYVYANAQQAEALAHAVTSGQVSGLYENQVEDVYSEEPLSHAPSGLLARHTSSVRDVSQHPPLRSDISTGLGDGGYGLANDDQFAGFWKPNRLY